MTKALAEARTAYEADIYAWSLEQAELLRDMAARRVNTPLDLENLAEEIEDVGRAQLHAAQSQAIRIIEHLLKLEFSPAQDPRPGWTRTIISARAELADRLTPTIAREVRTKLPRMFQTARRLAESAIEEFDGAEAAARLPAECLYSFEQILEQDWYPPRAGPGQAGR